MTTKRTKAAAPQNASISARPAAVVGPGDDPSHVRVRVAAGGPRSRSAVARLALAVPYRPAEGDRVLIAGEGDELYVIGVLHTSAPQAIALADGGSVSVRESTMELRDREGRLLVRYEDGRAEIAAPAGDLTLSAPEGRVVIASGKDVSIAAGRDEGATPQIRVGSATTSIEVDRLDVKSADSRVSAGRATVTAETLATTATALIQRAERFELTATRLVEKTRDAFREATDLAQTRAGRARTLVKDVYSLFSRRTSMESTEDTSIDGSKILLG